MNTTITAGARIRVRRYNDLGRLHFIKEGLVLEVHPSLPLFFFQDQDGNRRWLNTNPEEVGQIMTGWSQTYEAL
ncbi:hypothetical protein [Streptomyces sp. NPDC094049]|uniref:hypothetical protein n=1 Tax=Streptomyces sp. NPDC094049 TaxID=3154987 RepID=UPI00332D8DE8